MDDARRSRLRKLLADDYENSLLSDAMYRSEICEERFANFSDEDLLQAAHDAGLEFSVEVTSGTGHEEMDAENDSSPSVYYFETEAERQAFVHGINVASDALEGWTDGWIRVGEKE